MEVKEEKIEPEISKPPVVQVSEQQNKKSYFGEVLAI